ncbi:MAG: putative quinol monooxygenase, partial [Bacteroidota bacterium]
CDMSRRLYLVHILIQVFYLLLCIPFFYSCPLTIIEVYANLEAYQSHILTPHFKKYKDTVKDMVFSLELIDAELIERVHKDDFK